MRRRLRLSLQVMIGLFLLLLVSPVRPGQAQTPDPALPGPYAVTRQDYNFGDSAFRPFINRGSPTLWPGPCELTGSVHYPTGLSGGPFPLVVFMHGRHSTAYAPGTIQGMLRWPPVSPLGVPLIPIDSYTGYDYISEVLASHGYIVVSVGANGVNAQDNTTPDRGMYARSQVMQKHLDIWRAFSTTGSATENNVTISLPQFVGKVDLNNVGTMGHSRGGEGVVHHYVDNLALGAPYNVRAVLPLAPVDFNRFIANNVPLFVILPYCDGDVSDLQGAKFFDDSRYNVSGDLTPKHMLTVMGANHNFFNTAWTPGLYPAGTSDDWGTTRDPFGNPTIPGNSRLTAAQQRSVGLVYMTAFFRCYLGGETQFQPFLKGDAPPPASSATNYLYSFYHAPDVSAERRDLNRFLDASYLTLNSVGGQVTPVGLAPFEVVGGEVPQPQFALVGQPNARQPHNSPSLMPRRGLAQLRMSWSAPGASLTNELPVGAGNISNFKTLQFRAAVNFQAYVVKPLPQSDFTVVLTDGAGNTASTLVSQWSSALYYPPGKLSPLPKVLLHSIRIPLTAFSGVNLSDIRSVKFQFDRQNNGALLLSDIGFCDPAPVITVSAPLKKFSLPSRERPMVSVLDDLWLGNSAKSPFSWSLTNVSDDKKEAARN